MTAFFLVAGFLLLWLGLGGYVFYSACVRRREIDWLAPDGMKGTPYERYEELAHASADWLENHGAQEVSIQSRDGLRLVGRYIPAKEKRGTVILCHGYRSTMLVDFGMVFSFYHDLGMDILAIEQRCHAASQGSFITFGVKESQDLLDWLAFQQSELGGGAVILSGLSMGASTVMYVADRKLPPAVKGFIVDCGFTSPAAIINKVFRDRIHIPAGPVLWAAELWARLVAGFSLYGRDSRKILPKNHLPILMVHGTGDTFVPCEMTRQAYQVCAGEKTLLLVEGASHGTSFVTDHKQYTQLVTAFLEKYLEETK